jgi:DNA mismatch repair protein MutS2
MLLAGCEDLEFARVLAYAAGHCQSEAGRQLLLNAAPAASRPEVERLLDETAEGIGFVQQVLPANPISFSLLPQTTAFLGAFHTGLMPEREEIARLGEFFAVDKSARKALAQLTFARYPRLAELTAELADITELAADFARKFNEEGEVRDGASRELKELRRDAGRLQSDIESRLHYLIRKRAPDLAEEIHLSIRNNRLTLNVPTGVLSRFKGMVVDYSGTGASAYVEPKEIVEYNNQRQHLFHAEEMEVRRIVQEFTHAVEANRDRLAGNFEILARLDAVLGRARYSASINGTRPQLSDGGHIRLRQAKHPLMLENFVPEDFIFEDERIAIISGVNAGGKSLLLKMVGLFALMSYTGLYLPAGEGTCIGLYDGVLVNIGDEQSVLNNLSTFTAHVGFLRDLLDELGGREDHPRPALVLIDELGTGTDPGEGSALGYTLLERLRQLPAKAAVTTHYDLIKTLGEKYADCKNVSLAFDEDELRPTYRVLDGIPGKSFAFDIARSEGLPAALVDRAHGYVDAAEEVFTEVVGELRRKQDELEREIASIVRQRRECELKAKEAEEEKQALRERERHLRRRLDDLKRDFDVRVEEFVAGAKRRLRKKLRDSAGRSGLEVASEFSAEVQSERQSALAELERELGLTPEPGEAGQMFAVGEKLRLHSLGVDGEVTRVDEARRALELNVRGKTLKLTFEKAAEMLRTPEEAPAGTGHSRMTRAQREELRKLGAELDKEAGGGLLTTAHQLDIHGHTTDEALPKLEKFVSDAILHDFMTVAIMHGVGSGRLQKFVRGWLKSCPDVASYREATAEEGGKGITIATLK